MQYLFQGSRASGPGFHFWEAAGKAVAGGKASLQTQAPDKQFPDQSLTACRTGRTRTSAKFKADYLPLKYEEVLFIHD